MSPEYLPEVIENLLQNGALDAFITPIIMKKARPGYIVSAVCKEEKIGRIEKIIFQNTSSIGLRKREVLRTELNRKNEKIIFSYGEVNVKISYYHDKVVNFKPEHDDIIKLAGIHNTSPKVILDVFYKESRIKIL